MQQIIGLFQLVHRELAALYSSKIEAKSRFLLEIFISIKFEVFLLKQSTHAYFSQITHSFRSLVSVEIS